MVGADEPPSEDVQVVSERTGLPGSMVLDANTVRTVLSMLQGPKIDNDAWVHDVGIEEDDEGIHITVTVGPTSDRTSPSPKPSRTFIPGWVHGPMPSSASA